MKQAQYEVVAVVLATYIIVKVYTCHFFFLFLEWLFPTRTTCYRVCQFKCLRLYLLRLISRDVNVMGCALT